jgi:enoyl-CoA hydratase
MKSIIFETIALEKKMQVLQIQLNRPSALNALNRACLKEIHSALDIAQKDRKIALFLITGIGDRAFSVGADLNDLATLVTSGDRRGVSEYSRLFESLFERLESSKILSMAAVNGLAIGAGAELALACDIRLFSTKGYLAFPETGFGLVSPTRRLARLCGQSCVYQFTLTGERIIAERAKQMGLALDVLSDHDFHEKAVALALSFARRNLNAIWLTKAAVRKRQNKDPAYHSPGLFFAQDFRRMLRSFQTRSDRR